MSSNERVDRRTALKIAFASGITGFAAVSQAAPVGAMMPGKGWMAANGEACDGDGTPLQFIPKKQPDEEPLKDELSKYPTCPYCGMNRTKFHHSRHLVQYDDNLVDGTCSIHCLAISLSLNLDRGPKMIWAADASSSEKIQPLMDVDSATYLVGAKKSGVMSKVSKQAFPSKGAASAVQAEQGGELVDFDGALKAAYLDMAGDTFMIRKRRKEKRERMMKKKQAG